MIVVADASVLVGELLRKRGRELLLRPELQVLVAEDQWSETQHELLRRLGIMESTGRLSPASRQALEEAVQGLIESKVIDVISRAMYAPFERPNSTARHGRIANTSIAERCSRLSRSPVYGSESYARSVGPT